MTTIVQGTVLIVTVDVADPDTGALFDPPDFEATILPPTKANRYVLKFSLGQLVRQALGIYRFRMDSSPEPGEWKYEAKATGASARVVVRVVEVLPAL